MVRFKVFMTACCFFALISGCAKNPDQTVPKYTNEQWLQMVRQRQYQPVRSWEGISRGSLRDNGAGMSGSSMQFDGPPAYGVRQYLSQNLEQTPLFLLPLMTEREDTDIVCTGLYVYEYILSDDLKSQYSDEISDAFRTLLNHRDSSVRATALSYLQRNRWLTCEDIDRTMSDESLSVAYNAVCAAETLLDEKHKQVIYDENGRRIAGSDLALKQIIELKRKLVPIMLDHLNDTHFFSRSICADICHHAVCRYVKTEGGITEKKPPNYPDRYDWMRSNYADRVQKQKEWKQWWADYGEECLRFAHPDAPDEVFQETD